MVVDNEEEWEAEEVLDSRKYRGKLQDRAKWKGYPPDDVWYDAEGFGNADDAVSLFHRRYPRKPKA